MAEIIPTQSSTSTPVTPHLEDAVHEVVRPAGTARDAAAILLRWDEATGMLRPVSASVRSAA